MQLALDLARQALWLTSPNPRVGCVITSQDGTLLGQGHTQAAGQAHAEIMALRQAQTRGHDVHGATAWVTLEPCAHHGRTGPCADALLAAGIGRVVAATSDPNPQVAGQGLARLQAAGVATQVLPSSDPLHAQAHELNLGFFKRMTHGLPWVRLKTACSMDGQTALANGQSQWLTGQAARDDGHAWRARACAVLTGMGTVLADDPALNVRAHPTPRQPHLALVDTRLELPLTAKLLDTLGQGGRRIWIYTAADAQHPKRAALRARGAEVVDCANALGQVDLHAMLRDLARQEINELHVEAGHRLNGALMQAGCVDEWLIYQAPVWLGPGRSMAQTPALAQLAHAQRLQFVSVDRVGLDLRTRLRVAPATDL